MNDLAVKRTKSKSLADYAYKHIRDDIMHGFLKPGHKLRLEQLCERYEVGMSPLREALSRLAGDALVVNESQRGFWVAPLSLEELEDIVSIIKILREEAYHRSLNNGGEEWEAELHAAFEGLNEIEERYDIDDMDPEVWVPANDRFHEALIAANGSPWLTRMLNTLYQQAERYFMIAQVKTNIDSANHEEHRGMYEAAIERNLLKLSRLAEAHTSHLIDGVKSVLDQ